MSQNDWINKISTGIKLGDKYQLIRKQPQGGGGPVFIGIMLERKIPVHIRFFSPEQIADMKSFNQRLQTAKKAHELSSSFVTLPSDYGFHEGVPYTVVGISNLKTMDTFLQSGQRLDNAEKKALVEALLKMLIQVHSGGVTHYGLCSLSIHQGKESFSSTSIGVVDFGLVPSEGHSYFSSPAQDEKLLSVVSYAAPEQAAGRGDVDHRADLYSLGVLIYRLLTGHVPFEAGSVDEILKKVTSEPPPGLDGDKGFPEDIGGFMNRALEKNPKDRFQSAADMMESFLEASKDLPGEIVVKDRVRPSEPAEKGQAPVVILKVSEKDAGKMDEASSQEITAEIGGGAEATTEPRSRDNDLARKKATHKTDLFIQVPDKVLGDKEASGSGGDQIKKTRDKTDLFIKGPDQAQEGEPDKPGPEKVEKAQAAKPAPMKPIFKPVKAKEKTELFIKAEAGEPGQADRKDVKPAKAGGVLQAFLKKKEKTIPPVDVKPETPKAEAPKAEAPGAQVPQGQQALDDEKTSEISIEMDMEDGTYKIEEKTPGKAEPKKDAEKGEYVEFGKAPDVGRPEERKAAEKKPTALKRPSEKIKKRPVPTEDADKPAIGRIQLKEPRKLVSKPPPKKEVASVKKDEVIKPVPPPPIIRAADKGPDKKAEAKKEVPKPPVPVPGMDVLDKDKKKKEAAAPAAEPEKKAEVVEKEVTIEQDAEKAKKMKLYVGIGAVAAVLIVIISIILISSSGNEASNEGQESSTETQSPSEAQPPAEKQPPAEEAEGSEAEAQEEPAEGEEEAASASQEPGTEEAAEKPQEETPPEKEPAAPVKKATTKKTPTIKKAATKKATTKKATTKKTPTTKKTTTKKGKKSGLEFVD